MPEAFEAIVLQAMAKNPNDRYASADELRQDLLRFRQGRMVLANPTVAVPVVDTTVAAPAFESTRTMDRTQVGRVAAGPPPPPPKRGTGAFVVLLLVLLAVLGGLLWFVANETGIIGDQDAELVEMPLVIGKTADEATHRARGRSGSRSSSTPLPIGPAGARPGVRPGPAGRQPGRQGRRGHDQGGGRGGEGEAAALRRARTSTTRGTWPSWRSVTLAVKEEPSATVEADKVISQDPAAGHGGRQGQQRRHRRVVGSSNQKAVPDVAGNELADAANELGQAGFKTKTAREASNSVDEGKVIRTDPPAGDRVPEGRHDHDRRLVGRRADHRPERHWEVGRGREGGDRGAGLVFQNAGTANSNQDQDGKVVQQNPAGGTKVEKGSTVRVTIGKASILPTTSTSSGSSTTSSTAGN